VTSHSLIYSDDLVGAFKNHILISPGLPWSNRPQTHTNFVQTCYCVFILNVAAEV
jgi:hypothetical protein